ncbi:MAG: hypothetical protein JXB15_04130 [Anaerolineales bacterium]|nr:hypothetical protein [Anaerolineales bacterium]
MTTKQIHLWPVEPSEQEGQLTVGTYVEMPDGSRVSLWFRLPAEHHPALTRSSDPFVLGTLFMAMRKAADLVVHGAVSPSLIRSLAEFQEAWWAWKPKTYTRIEILADELVEQPRAAGDRTIMMFSGGVDACFTAYRHHHGLCGQLRRDVQAGIFVQGFEIPLNRPEIFRQAEAKSRAMLESLGMECIPLATNIKKIGADWEDEHGLALASILSLFQGGYTAGLIANSDTYYDLGTVLPWGSNQVTDHMGSSDSFAILHDGGGYSRPAKLRLMADWEEMQRNLRVCVLGFRQDGGYEHNCCRCEKCVRTILYFRLAGKGLPPAFERDVSDWQVMKTFVPIRGKLNDVQDMLRMAHELRIRASWVNALRVSYAASNLRLGLKNVIKTAK